MPVQLNINELINAVVSFILDKSGQGWITSIALAMAAGFSVVFIIVRGSELYFKDASPGELIIQSALRIGFVVFLITQYDTFFYNYLWEGMINDVAYRVGTLALMDTVYEIVLLLLGALVTVGMVSIMTGGLPILIIAILIAVCGVAYGCVLLGLLESVLVAGLFFTIGKLCIPLILFDSTSNWFWAWLRNYIGALLGIACVYFFLGALNEMPVWIQIRNSLSSIENLAKSLNQVINIAIMMVACGLLTVRSGSIGRQILS